MTQQTEAYAGLKITIVSKHLTPVQKEKITQAGEQFKMKTIEAQKKFKRRVKRILKANQ